VKLQNKNGNKTFFNIGDTAKTLSKDELSRTSHTRMNKCQWHFNLKTNNIACKLPPVNITAQLCYRITNGCIISRR
jgi:hypothetical protein